MSSYDPDDNGEIGRGARPEPGLILAELVRQPPMQAPPDARIARRRVRLPVLLFIATCLSTLLAGYVYADPHAAWTAQLLHGLKYALPVMTILICHEAGHFLQARRYGVYASFPYFIPMPISPLGTLGAVIVMEPRMGHRRALFDIGITGPLAGLVPTLVFCVWGLYLSEVRSYTPTGREMMLGEPLLFNWLATGIREPTPEGHELFLHPVAFAGWVGLLITALNLLPIGQLDGGHILYGLLRSKAQYVGFLLLLMAGLAVLWGFWWWWPMVIVLLLMGTRHPPTSDDQMPLGVWRIVLGWLTLAFIPIGFTPTPFLVSQ